jgi:hypothetical protein
MKRKKYVLIGAFFPSDKELALDQNPGLVPEYTMFNAIIAPSTESSYGGKMYDEQKGWSDITEFKISDKTLTFKKHYPNSTGFDYLFDKCPDGTYLGTWTNMFNGTGKARCCLTEIDESCFYRQRE